ncbi:GPW/gp25 family protein [Chloroflexi bacterium TSY]|nr:GPW/gp25 family protein [Chloroflexi bacterium TSY]
MTEQIVGFSIPFRIEAGRVAQANGVEKIKENIIHILLTGIGERVMRRDYGGGLRQLVHDPNNDALRSIVQHQIAKAIGQWEPRVLLQSVTVTQHPQEGTLIAELQYVIRRTQQRQKVSVPLGLGGV